MILECLKVGPLETNCYVFADEKTKDAVVIDPGAEPERILTTIKDNALKVKHIALTHGHWDHVQALGEIKVATDAHIMIHELDADSLRNPLKSLACLFGIEKTQPSADRLLEDNDTFMVGTYKVTVIHTPGHTPGGVCFLVDDILFSGDTLFKDGYGRTDLPGGDYETLIHSITEKLVTLSENTLVYPGHGESTTIGHEKQNF